jgi:hypothetical protein
MNDLPPSTCLINESHLGYAAFGALESAREIRARHVRNHSSAIYNAIGKWILEYPTTPDRC